jgi:hypothetical protein
MARPSYIAGNLAAGASITYSSQDSANPAANTVDGDFASVLRFTSGASNWLEYDLVAQYPVSAVFLGNHNFISGSGGGVTIKAGNSPAPSTVVASPEHRAESMVGLFTEASYRYIRIEISDLQAGADVTQLGEVVIGARVQLPRGVRHGEKPHQVQEAIVERTNRGKRYALEMFQLPRREYTFRFPQTELATFRTWWDAVGGVLDPFVWLPENGAECYYMSIEDQGFLPDELPEQAAVPVLDYKVALIGESIGAEILV